MELVHLTRVEPEVAGGPTALDVQKQDVEALKKRGWTEVKAKPAKAEIPVTESEEKSDEKKEVKKDSKKK